MAGANGLSSKGGSAKSVGTKPASAALRIQGGRIGSLSGMGEATVKFRGKEYGVRAGHGSKSAYVWDKSTGKDNRSLAHGIPANVTRRGTAIIDAAHKRAVMKDRASGNIWGRA